MNPLPLRYIALHHQGFVPIMVADELDAVLLAEASVCAGARVVEITCRRLSVMDDIRRVQRAFPDLLILVGSVVDDGPMFRSLQSKRPEFPSIDQLLDLGIAGLVSAWPMSQATIERGCKSHLMLPGVETVAEAVSAVEAGADFAKLFSTSLMGGPSRVELMSCAPLYGLLPLFVTGGVTKELIPRFMGAGAAIVGSGWDLILKGQLGLDARSDARQLGELLRAWMSETQSARAAIGALWPSMPEDYLASLSHHHRFS